MNDPFDLDWASLVTPNHRRRKITSTSTEGQTLHENLAPVLVIISEKSLVISRKIITSTGFYWYCAPDASAPVVVINESPQLSRAAKRGGFQTQGFPDWDLSSLFCPFFSFFCPLEISPFREFPDLPGIFPESSLS